ncbi:MAG: thioredoxin domain-containing protein [Limnospira sp. PMC 1291.21]|uniref:Thioredoxin-1 n=2 Tax=Limnospira TaxID=2596745 RepID=A0A9P1KBI3_9CYAN|nr:MULTISPECIES: thioredoxin domain-containing protein [Limnospira]MDT9179293.1 thioredoxin domain-containing protein [Limnospira sp. PMC 1238.20]MDT9189496.1 thioredoxin domain-containing protein [Limnospira sp. PMC 894.15]MDT9194523.1 thioredoxin domain-containing protein [Limnospira sp. PMC 1245.20]MDT9199777.1 thioredoxin domain-containing protein [Limnospira sp. PMC 1042.18]MDT9204867.1 thioredoxin domain-containing protein [Limnospira sp. PMC 1243.20]
MLLSVSEQQFSKEVLSASTPILVHFWAPWCGLCKLIVPQLEQFQTQWTGQVQVFGINADQNLKLASTYRLQNLPTLILFHQGEPLYRIEHLLRREDLLKTLNGFMLNYQHDCYTRPLKTPEYLQLEA